LRAFCAVRKQSTPQVTPVEGVNPVAILPCIIARIVPDGCDVCNDFYFAANTACVNADGNKLHQVRVAAIPHRPDWVIKTGIRYAEQPIEAAKAKYYEGAVQRTVGSGQAGISATGECCGLAAIPR
jgi:hypothetical protein